MRFTDLFQPKMGPDGEIGFVPKGSRKDPWLGKRRDRCPMCLARNKVTRGKLIERGTPSLKGNVFDEYECPVCGYKWVRDKRVKYWSGEDIARFRKISATRR